MPEESYWNSLFDTPAIVDWLALKNVDGPIAEIGCGYGTFTVPVAREAKGEVHAFDIEPSMIERTGENLRRPRLDNVKLHLRDVVQDGTGLEADRVGMVLLFNILHFEERRILLEEASRILKPNGVAAIIHWRKDIATPRGPSMESRPDEKMIIESAKGLDLYSEGKSVILEPYHWGVRLVKTGS